MGDEREHPVLLCQCLLYLLGDLAGFLCGQQIDEQIVGDRPCGYTLDEDNIFPVLVSDESHQLILVERPRFPEVGESQGVIEFIPFVGFGADSDRHAQ